MAKRSSGFNTPFTNLKLAFLSPGGRGRAAGSGLPPAPPPEPAPPPPPKVAPADEALFDEAMRQVAPMAKDPRGRLGPLGASLEIGRPPRRSKAEDEAEAYAELADLIDGTAAFDISSTDEYIEGSADGIDRRLVKKLRRGEYAIQAHIDLHGFVQTDARIEVERFLDEARVRGLRCVLIVHGRGLHSKEAVPVLKERVQVWLSRGRLSRGVLCFCSARPADGGAGAVYVLLRK